MMSNTSKKFFEKLGHECQLPNEPDEMLIQIPGYSCVARLRRAIRRLAMVSPLNPRSQKYLRSQAAIHKEKKRHLSEYYYMIHPFSHLRKWWEFFMILVLLLQIFTIPLDIGFEELRGAGKNLGWVHIRMHLELACVVDIIINLMTGYFDARRKEIVLNPKRVALHYLKTYLILDIVSSLPIEVCKTIFHFRNKMVIRVLQTLSLLKIARMFSMLNYITQMVEAFEISNVTHKIFNLILLPLIYLHWVAALCIPVAIISINVSPEGSVSWFTQNNLHESNFAYIYLKALYRGTCIATSSAFDDEEVGHLIPDMWFTIIFWITSRLLYIFFLAGVMQLCQGQQSSKGKYKEMVQQLKEYMHYKQLPQRLVQRLLMYYEFRFQKSYFRETEILNTLSGQLRQDIIMHSCQQLVEKVLFFNNIPLSLLVRIVSCMKMEIFLTNDVIIRANTVGDCMYFIASGTVAVYGESGKEICHLEDGDHFGEIALVMKNQKRVASVVAVGICELYRLNQKDFLRAIHPYPDLLENIEHIAWERLEATMLIDDEYRRYKAHALW